MNSSSLGKNANSLLQTPESPDQLDDLAGRDLAGVGHVVGAERHALRPAGEGGLDELIQLRDRVGRLEEPRVAHELGQVVPRVVDAVEGDAQPPDEHVGVAGQDLLAQGLRPAVERAVVGPEGEVGRVLLGEAVAARAVAAVDAARGDMAPRDPGLLAGLGDDAREDGVAEEALAPCGARRRRRWACPCSRPH